MLFFVLVYFCGVLLCVFTLLVPCCYVRYKFRITTISGSFLPPDACKEARVLFTLFVFAYVYCFVFFCLRPVSCVPNVSSFSGLSFC